MRADLNASKIKHWKLCLYLFTFMQSLQSGVVLNKYLFKLTIHSSIFVATGLAWKTLPRLPTLTLHQHSELKHPFRWDVKHLSQPVGQPWLRRVEHLSRYLGPSMCWRIHGQDTEGCSTRWSASTLHSSCVWMCKWEIAVKRFGLKFYMSVDHVQSRSETASAG